MTNSMTNSAAKQPYESNHFEVNMKQTKFSILRNITVILMIVLSASLVTGCGEATSNAKEEPPVALVPVNVSKAVAGNIDAAYGSTAVLEAAEEARVLARQAGVVVSLNVEEGDLVEAGQILAQLETDQLGLKLRQAEAQLKQFENDLQRNQKIYQQNLISSEAFERIKFQYEAQKAQTELARLNLEHATIRAPISGIIANRYIKVGNMLKTNQDAFHITDMSTLHAVIHLPESEKADLQSGQVAHLKVSSYDQVFTGSIERISPVVDRDTGTIRVTVAISEHDKLLRPGMFSRVGVIYDTHEDAILIPKTALVSQDNEYFVFTVTEGKANKTTVEVGFSDAQNIEITNGINVDDLVITMGQRNLRDQADIEIIEAVAAR